jgi:5'-deoxynucleotidase YfbR-like HD superfamily hydrolase
MTHDLTGRQEHPLPQPTQDPTRGVDAETMLQLVSKLALPPYQIERATTVPFDRARHENDAEHSFSLGIIALCVAPLFDEKLDLSRICTYALIHDLQEIYAGDTPIYSDPQLLASKPEREQAARTELRRQFGETFPWFIEYIDNYVHLKDDESKFVYALDKMLPHTFVILGNYHPAKPTWQTYKQVESVARAKISTSYPNLSQLFDELCKLYERMPQLFAPERA